MGECRCGMGGCVCLDMGVLVWVGVSVGVVWLDMCERVWCGCVNLGVAGHGSVSVGGCGRATTGDGFPQACLGKT